MRQFGRAKNSVCTVSFFGPTSNASRRPIGALSRSGIRSMIAGRLMGERETVHAEARRRGGRTRRSRKHRRRVVPENLSLDILTKSEAEELLDVLPRRHHARRRPVGAPQDFVREGGHAWN